MLKQDGDSPMSTSPPPLALPREPSPRQSPVGEWGSSTAGAEPLPESVRAQLAREFADIELAAAALRRAEPALESWSGEASPSGPKPHPVWLLVGLLWLSTALVAASAVFAIVTLAGRLGS
jgi:hypothetical protein